MILPISDEERESLRSAFDDYRATGDEDLRDRIVEAHVRLAVHLARRFDNRGVPLDDLVQVASLGLLKAVERFEPERGHEFSTFATPTIMGELKRHFRDKGWTIRVPRRVQELHVRLNVLVEELTQRLGRSPTIGELATAVGASEEQVLEALEATNAYRAASIDSGVPSESAPTLEAWLGRLDPEATQVENRLLVEGLIATLPPRERLMVELRFFEEMSQSEIAARLGISQMHVSRLLARCLDTLRERLAADGVDHDPT